MVPEYINAIANLLGVIIWPLLVVVLVIVLVLTQHKELARLLHGLKIKGIRLGNIVIEIEGMVDALAQATLSTGPHAEQAPTTDKQSKAAERVEQFARDVDLSVIRKQVLELAREYENTRSVLPAGNERNHKMNLIITKMRVLGLAAFPLLPELTSSSSQGARLAASAILQVKPSSDYLQWLAQRVAEDPGSFHGYHAAVSLRRAAEGVLDTSQLEELQNAINTARTSAKPETRGADAFKNVLDKAEEEIRRKRRDIAA